jgi:hypothetical protein
MGALAGFVLGYVLGVKAGPEGHKELRDAWKAFIDSQELKGLVLAARNFASDAAGRANGALGEQLRALSSERPDLARAIRSILETTDFEALLATGTGVVEGLLVQAQNAVREAAHPRRASVWRRMNVFSRQRRQRMALRAIFPGQN